MTYSAVPALRAQPELAAEWEPRLTSTDVRPAHASRRPRRRGALCGMAMTEKQGGSDVRANTTRARAARRAAARAASTRSPGTSGSARRRCATRSSCSRRPSAGSSCFLLPRWLPDGTRNRFHIQRLKDKLGNRSNASSEVEFDGAWARMVGEEGRGVPTIIEMVNHTRLDCVIGVGGRHAPGGRAGDAPRRAPRARSASGSSSSR